MKLKDILLTGMDIPNETRKLLSRFTVTDGMTESELKAYKMGVENAISAMHTLTNLGQIVFHLEGNDCIEEFDFDDLIEIVEEKEGYQYE